MRSARGAPFLGNYLVSGTAASRDAFAKPGVLAGMMCYSFSFGQKRVGFGGYLVVRNGARAVGQASGKAEFE